jgi:uncharacterized protein YutE (UPF0331/DUF86 family)
MSSQLQEADVLENIVPQLEAEGFEVYTRPSASLLPPFMQPYPPDAIALRDDKKLAIEVVRKGPTAQERLGKLRELLTGRRDWELRVYWISPSNAPEPIDRASGQEIDRAIKTIEQLMGDGSLGPALLMAWAALEALGRALLPGRLARPQTAGRLVEALAGDGCITPTEADLLRALAKVRNQLAHGGLRARIASKDIKKLAAILRALQMLLEDA